MQAIDDFTPIFVGKTVGGYVTLTHRLDRREAEDM
jgi:hypothetical protein